MPEISLVTADALETLGFLVDCSTSGKEGSTELESSYEHKDLNYTYTRKVASTLFHAATRLRELHLVSDFESAVEEFESNIDHPWGVGFVFDTLESVFREWTTEKEENGGLLSCRNAPLLTNIGLSRRRFNIARTICIGIQEVMKQGKISDIIDRDKVERLINFCTPIFEIDESVESSWESCDDRFTT